MANLKQSKLDDLKEKIILDKVTPELAKDATNLVFGEGDPSAEIVFIGEAPGKNEDIEGRPFIGAAGKFLNEMLETIGLKRTQVYITNIVKYRPKNNRDPLPEEKAEFLPYLDEQLSIIEPKLIVTLGRHPLSVFIPSAQISKCHGKPIRFKNRVFLPLFHPAAALYNGSMRQTLIDDFSLIPAVLNKLEEN